MANPGTGIDVEIYDGNPVFKPGMTPFGLYDNDASFQSDIIKATKWMALRLGYPLMDVELQSGSFFAAFEEAITTYGNQIYSWKVRENYLSLEGSIVGTAGSANNLVVEPTLQRIVEISKNYGTEADVGGNIPLNVGMLDLHRNQQTYDLKQWAQDQGVEGGIEIRKVFYEAPPAIMRYFDPYAGTGTGMQSMMDAFDFGSFSPGINFMLMPVSFDILKIQAIEFNDQVRKSAYSFRLNDNQLQLFPIPTRDDIKLRIEYYKISDKRRIGYTSDEGSTDPLITNISEVPYENPVYSKINSIGRTWIYKYALAVAKEMLAHVRGKYSQLPIPDSETTLNHADLLSGAKAEKEELMKELTEMLDATSRKSQLERKSEEAEALKKTLSSVPMQIYIG